MSWTVSVPQGNMRSMSDRDVVTFQIDEEDRKALDALLALFPSIKQKSIVYRAIFRLGMAPLWENQSLLHSVKAPELPPAPAAKKRSS